MNSTPNRIVILETGDLHFGNPNLDHENMYMALSQLFIPKIADSHLLVIAGDYFDTLLDFSSSYATYALMFIRDVLSHCIQYNVKLRIVSGTYSHDRDQCKIFSSLISKEYNDSRIDYRYITTIDIEEIPFHNNTTLYVGYIPDSLPYKQGQKVADILREKIDNLGWKKLHVIFGHGTFAHCLPPNITLPPCTYTLSMFENLTDIMVMNHIHIASKKQYVYYSGSFDRLAHNEESDKGFLSLIYENNTWKVHFHKNPYATIYKTINLTQYSPDDAIRTYKEWLYANIPDTRAFVRAIHEDVEVRNALNKITAEIKPLTIFTSMSPSDTEKLVVRSLEDYKQDIVQFVIPTEDNLPELIYEYLNNSTIPKEEILSIEEITAYLNTVTDK
jgi:hypothetical protein